MLLLIALLAGLGIEIKQKLPVLVPGSDKLGFLRREFGFIMSDIELIIHNYRKTIGNEKNNKDWNNYLRPVQRLCRGKMPQGNEGAQRCI